MCIIAIVAYDEMSPAVRWQEYSLLSRGLFVPASRASALLKALWPFRDRVEAVHASAGGDVVGFRVSNRVTPRSAYRLRDLLQPFLQSIQDPTPPATPGRDAPDIILSLSKHGLQIPEPHVDRAKQTLSKLGAIQIKFDEDEGVHIVAIGIPASVALPSVFAALAVDVVTVEPSHGHRRKQLLESLRRELQQLEELYSVRAS